MKSEKIHSSVFEFVNEQFSHQAQNCLFKSTFKSMVVSFLFYFSVNSLCINC